MIRTNEEHKEMSKKYAASPFNQLVAYAMKQNPELSIGAAIAQTATQYPNIHAKSICEANGEVYEQGGGQEIDSNSLFANSEFYKKVEAEMNRDNTLTMAEAITMMVARHPDLHSDAISAANGMRHPGDLEAQVAGTRIETAAKALMAKDMSLSMRQAIIEVGKSIIAQGTRA